MLNGGTVMLNGGTLMLNGNVEWCCFNGILPGLLDC